ncbi:hypothetical protein [Acidisphaera sp. L21]|nr:hypothetical protein [Acidisphaera sp. L21]
MTNPPLTPSQMANEINRLQAEVAGWKRKYELVIESVGVAEREIRAA